MLFGRVDFTEPSISGLSNYAGITNAYPIAAGLDHHALCR